MVIQPLFRKLNSERVLYRAYFKSPTDGTIVLELASKTKPYYAIQTSSKKDIIAGNQNIIPEVVYELHAETYERIRPKEDCKTSISQFIINKVEIWLKEVYTFREDHKVTEYK